MDNIQRDFQNRKRLASRPNSPIRMGQTGAAAPPPTAPPPSATPPKPNVNDPVERARQARATNPTDPSRTPRGAAPTAPAASAAPGGAKPSLLGRIGTGLRAALSSPAGLGVQAALFPTEAGVSQAQAEMDAQSGLTGRNFKPVDEGSEKPSDTPTLPERVAPRTASVGPGLPTGITETRGQFGERSFSQTPGEKIGPSNLNVVSPRGFVQSTDRTLGRGAFSPEARSEQAMALRMEQERAKRDASTPNPSNLDIEQARGLRKLDDEIARQSAGGLGVRRLLEQRNDAVAEAQRTSAQIRGQDVGAEIQARGQDMTAAANRSRLNLDIEKENNDRRVAAADAIQKQTKTTAEEAQGQVDRITKRLDELAPAIADKSGKDPQVVASELKDFTLRNLENLPEGVTADEASTMMSNFYQVLPMLEQQLGIQSQDIFKLVDDPVQGGAVAFLSKITGIGESGARLDEIGATLGQAFKAALPFTDDVFLPGQDPVSGDPIALRAPDPFKNPVGRELLKDRNRTMRNP